MADVRYPTFGKAFSKCLGDADVQAVAEAMDLSFGKIIATQAGEYLPSIPEINSFGAHLKLTKKQVSDLVDKAMDDLAAAGNEKKQAAPKKAPRTSSKHPVNRW